MADVSSKLLGQFADNLKQDVLTGGDAASPTDAPKAAETPTDARTTPTDGGVRKVESKEAQPIDLMDAAGGSVGKRIVPIVAGLVVVLTLRSIFKRRKRRKVRGQEG
jgi:hypothetical protein